MGCACSNEVPLLSPEEEMAQKRKQKVRACHILLKHSSCLHPWTHRNNEFVRRVTRDMATISMETILSSIRSGVDKEGKPCYFEDMAKKKSDCLSFKRGGDLGYVGRGDLDKVFEDVLFTLKVGEISGVVHTESGVHLIKRTA